MTTRIERKIYPDSSSFAHLTISANGDGGTVMISTDTPVSAEFFGNISLILDCTTMREIAAAILDAAEEAEEKERRTIRGY